MLTKMKKSLLKLNLNLNLKLKTEKWSGDVVDCYPFNLALIRLMVSQIRRLRTDGRRMYACATYGISSADTVKQS